MVENEMNQIDRIEQNQKRIIQLIHMANPNLEDKMNLQMVQSGQQNIADTVNNLAETVADLEEKVEELEEEEGDF